MRRETLLQQTNDDWYVRFPDGKVLHAPNTNTVRKNIHRGRIPLESTVRRTAEEEWVILAWTAEFADVAKRRGEEAKKPRRRRNKVVTTTNGATTRTSHRLDPHKLQTVAVRSFFPELLAALENTVMRGKLVAIVVSGLLLGSLFALSQYPLPDLGLARLWFNLILGVLAGLVLAATGALLTRATFVELSRLRPAKPQEVRHGWTSRTLRLFVAQLLVGGFAVALVLVLRALPQFLLPGEEQPWALAWQIAANVALVVAVIAEVLLWPVLLLTMLLAPVMVVEEGSLDAGLANWWRLLCRHPGSVLLYEMLAAGSGFVLAAVAALPLLLLGQPLDERISVTAATTRNVLLGLPAALLFAYLTVANMFIYLNLHYESSAVREQ
jgi:hypothetical protein